jgi:hypothetical protein
MGFCSLQRSGARRSTVRGFATPATFRPQGLAALSAAYSLRARAGFVSHRQRSWDSPFGAFSSRKVSARLREEEPTYRFSCRCYRRRSDGPARQAAVSGLLPLPESLAAGRGISAPPTGCSLGFHPSRACGRSLGRALTRPPLTRFTDAPQRVSRRLRVSIGFHFAPHRRRGDRSGWAEQPF